MREEDEDEDEDEAEDSDFVREIWVREEEEEEEVEEESEEEEGVGEWFMRMEKRWVMFGSPNIVGFGRSSGGRPVGRMGSARYISEFRWQNGVGKGQRIGLRNRAVMVLGKEMLEHVFHFYGIVRSKGSWFFVWCARVFGLYPSQPWRPNLLPFGA